MCIYIHIFLYLSSLIIIIIIIPPVLHRHIQ